MKFKSIRACACAVLLCATTPVLMPPLGAADRPAATGNPSVGDSAALIAEYGLRESPEPVATSPGWRRPTRIVVDAGVPGLVDVVRQQLSGAKPAIVVVAANTPAEMAAAAPGAQAAIGRTGVICDEKFLAAGQDLRWLQTVYAGVELCTARKALRERGILLTNMRAISGPVIAEHSIGMLIALSRGMHLSAQRQAAGEWNDDFTGTRLTSLTGKTVLVVGLGGIGGGIAKRAQGLGMRVIATRATRQARPDYVDYVGTPEELATLVAQADAVINAAPLTPATRGLFNAALFAKMKPTAYFINVGRGTAVVTDDLVQALNSRQIAGAALDVTDPEPLPKGHPLWRVPNLLLTPHMSGWTDDDGEPQRRVVQENLRRYAEGDRMLSVVDLDRGY